MIKITKEKIPHGSVPTFGLKDIAVANAIMQINENIISISRQLSIVQSALIEVQRKETHKK